MLHPPLVYRLPGGRGGAGGARDTWTHQNGPQNRGKDPIIDKGWQKNREKKQNKRTYFFGGREVFRCTAVALGQNSIQTRPSGTFAAKSRPHWPLAPTNGHHFREQGPRRASGTRWNSKKTAVDPPLKKRLFFLLWIFFNPLAEKRGNNTTTTKNQGKKQL
jgi:hypothetical protein